LVESLGALLIVELIALGIVALIAGALFLEVVFLFWAVASLALAPWWLLSAGLVGELGEGRNTSFSGPYSLRTGR
jgi:hypothetical protein